MEEKTIEKRCLDLWGEENQVYQMIEESSELITAICHRRKGRYNLDHVCEEIADCFNVLDQMDLVFGKMQPEPLTSFIDLSGEKCIISTIGQLHDALGQYIQTGKEGERAKELLGLFRQHLEYWAKITDNDSVTKWKDIKRERTLRIVELGEAKELL